MGNIGNAYFDTDNTVTESGSYTLAPTSVLGVLGSASMDVESGDGSPVSANVSLDGLLDTPITALSTYTVTAGDNTSVTVTAGTVALGTSVIVDADGGDVSLAGGLLTALSGVTINISNGGTFDGNGVISAASGLTLNFQGGGGTLNLAGSSGGLALLDGASINGFGTGDRIIVESDGAPATITSVDYDSFLGTSTVTFSNGDTLDLNGQYQDTDPGTDNYLGTVADTDGAGTVLVCFLSGSMVRTAQGDVAIEEIRVGDEILVHHEGRQVFRPVIWTGTATASVKPGPYPDEAGYPVRIVKDAIASGVPYRDMLVTPEHCLFFDGRFLPVRMLVNNRSIYYDRTISTYTYYHLETESHSIITVDGMLTESYLDTGNRHGFRQTGPVVRFPGQEKTWARDSAAPLDVSQDFVRPLFDMIDARACASDIPARHDVLETTADADLHLVTDSGAVIRAMREAKGFTFFMIPPDVQEIRIMSRTSRPCDTMGPYVDDRRHLGVLIRDIRLFEGNAARALTAHLGLDAPNGWHDSGSADRRWTDGKAVVELGRRQHALKALLCIEMLAAGPYRIAETEVTHEGNGLTRLSA